MTNLSNFEKQRQNVTDSKNDLFINIGSHDDAPEHFEIFNWSCWKLDSLKNYEIHINQ